MPHKPIHRSKKKSSPIADEATQTTKPDHIRVPKKAMRGESCYGYAQVKKNVNLTLTPDTIEILQKWADEKKLSKSELIEQIGRSGINPLSILRDEHSYQPQAE